MVEARVEVLDLGDLLKNTLGSVGGTMRKLIAAVILAGGVLLFPNVSKADGVNVTAAYSDHNKHYAFSESSKTISFPFNFPSALNSSLLDLNISVYVSFKGKSSWETGDIYLFSNAKGGLFDLDFTAKNHFYDFVIFGSQLFDSSNNLIPGSYAIGKFQGIDSLLYKDVGDEPTGIFTSGTAEWDCLLCSWQREVDCRRPVRLVSGIS
jgi:hypothetical protein